MRRLPKVYIAALLLTLVGFVVAYQYVAPAPPERIAIATGGEAGAYYAFGQRYRDILARHGIALEVVSTAGSVDNIRRLQDPASGIDIAFVQGGTGTPAEQRQLTSLGSLYFEPLWVFYRRELALEHLSDLRGRRIAVGPEGSGTRMLALQLLRANGIGEAAAVLLPLGDREAAAALREQTIDAAFFVVGLGSELIPDLLQTEGVELLSFERAEAYDRRFGFLSDVILPQGAIDLERDVPPARAVLLAPAASLVARPDLHPALIDLLLQAAAEVHGPGGLFETPGQFPSPRYLEFPLSSEAQRYYEHGPPFLQRYLPFWAATLVDRLKVLLLPLVALLIPLVKIVPPTYRWQVRSRIYRWYRQVEAVDKASAQERDGRRLRDYLVELDKIEHEVRRISVPLSYADALYSLRVHINLVRGQIRENLLEREANPSTESLRYTAGGEQYE